jgi:chaperonin GroES
MLLKVEGHDLSKFILIGDRVLIKPKSPNEKTKGGLYLPPGVEEKRKIQSGYVIKAGPGYPIPAPVESDEPWKESQERVKYFPLQAKGGDLAVYLQDNAFDQTDLHSSLWSMRLQNLSQTSLCCHPVHTVLHKPVTQSLNQTPDQPWLLSISSDWSFCQQYDTDFLKQASMSNSCQ